MEQLHELFTKILDSGGLQKIVFSKPKDQTVKRTEGRVIILKGEKVLQFETFYANGKVNHQNVPMSEAENELEKLTAQFGQINIFTTGGPCEILISSKGKCRILNRISKTMIPAEAENNDRKRHYILDPKVAAPFFFKLGVCSEKGEIFDKKRSKFRQINRFIEILNDCYSSLPETGQLVVGDLCCGKSYLTFAAYYFLTEVKKRDVKMYGVDLKSDVISFCRETARELGFCGMEFFCANILEFDFPKTPHLVLSLHACDIATDIVLYTAVRSSAKVILSTPCCQHEMANQLQCEQLHFVKEHSLLLQKMCDAFTDALRCKRLEAEGYKVITLELIDPEETPKNIMIKAIKTDSTPEKRDKALEEYREALEFLKVHPFLDKLFAHEHRKS